MAGSGRGRWRLSRSHRRRGGTNQGGRDGGNDDMAVKPDNRSSEEWICVRGQCIRRRGRIRVDANGNVYVPDSEDEEFDMEAGGVKVANLGGASVATDGVHTPVVGVPAYGVTVGADGVAGDGVDVVAEGVHTAAGEEMHPEVAVRLKTLLASMDPTFHDVFISMYKVMVPAFFHP